MAWSKVCAAELDEAVAVLESQIAEAVRECEVAQAAAEERNAADMTGVMMPLARRHVGARRVGHLQEAAEHVLEVAANAVAGHGRVTVAKV